MAKPTTSYDWATDAAYTSDGTNNKTEPTATVRAQGWEREEALPAQHINNVLNSHGLWIAWLEARFAANGEIVLPDPVQFTRYKNTDSAALLYGFETAWYKVSGSMVSTSDSAEMSLDISELLPRNARILHVYASVDPGAARSTAADRIQVELFRQNHGTFASPLTPPTATSEGSNNDDGTATAQWVDIDLSSAPVDVADGDTWSVQITGGNDGGSHVNDIIYCVAVVFDTTAITND